MKPTKSMPNKFKHAPHTAWRRVDTGSIILDLNTSVYYTLNDSGAFIWERLGEGASGAQIAAELCDEFDVKPEAAASDTAEIVEKFCAQKLLLPA